MIQRSIEYGGHCVEATLGIQNSLVLSLRINFKKEKLMKNSLIWKINLSLTFSISGNYVKKVNWFVLGYLNSDFETWTKTVHNT